MTRQTIDNKWAETGSIIDPGSTKVKAGWGAEIPPFETQNFWQNRADDVLSNAEKNGIMEYNAATVYSIGSWAMGTDREIYKSLTSNNVGNSPVSSPLNWISFSDLTTVVSATETVKGIAELATLAETQAGTDDTRIVTPKKLKDSIGQVVPDATTTTKGKVELASNSETQAGTDAVRSVTPAGLASVTATETRAGLVERATDAEAASGTDTVRYISPKQFKDNVNSLVPVATTTVQGKVELATNTEVRTATDATRAVTPASMGSFMTGWTLPFPVTTPPVGFVEAAGILLSRVTYSDLWAWVQVNARVVSEAEWSSSDSGAYSSGDLSTTFRIPDYRGEFLRGWDHGKGVDSGRVLGSRQDESVGPHTHPFVAQKNIGGFTDDGGAPDQRSTQQSLTTGQNSGTETRPRNVSVMWCIKT